MTSLRPRQRLADGAEADFPDPREPWHREQGTVAGWVPRGENAYRLGATHAYGFFGRAVDPEHDRYIIHQLQPGRTRVGRQYVIPAERVRPAARAR